MSVPSATTPHADEIARRIVELGWTGVAVPEAAPLAVPSLGSSISICHLCQALALYK